MYDQNGGFYSTTTVYGYLKKDDVLESYKCLMAILNSNLFWWFLINTGTVLANNYFRYKPNYIKPFPIPGKISIKEQEFLEKCVDELNQAVQENDQYKLRELIKKIDFTIYRIYELTDDEISYIEQVTK